MNREQKLEAAKRVLGERYVFHPSRVVKLSDQRRQDMSVLVLALAARMKR